MSPNQLPVSPFGPMDLTPEERSAGITKDLKVAARRFLCPVCYKEFSLFQSRAIACVACPKANQDCPNVRCPYCDNEFPIAGFIVPDKESAKHMNEYADGVFDNWMDSHGIVRR